MESAARGRSDRRTPAGGGGEGRRTGGRIVSLLLLAGVLALAWGSAGHWHGGQGDLENARVCAVCHSAHNPSSPGVPAPTVSAPPVLMAAEAPPAFRRPPTARIPLAKHPRAPPA